MMGIGLIIMFIGYAVIYWAINSFQSKSQYSFITYVFPFAGSH